MPSRILAVPRSDESASVVEPEALSPEPSSEPAGLLPCARRLNAERLCSVCRSETRSPGATKAPSTRSRCRNPSPGGPTYAWPFSHCLLYTSDAADDLLCVDLGGRRIITKQ